MTQGTLFIERPKPDELFKEGSQNYRLYKRLLDGPVTNAEVVREMNIFNSTGRASDIRKAVKPYLMDVDAKKAPGTKSLWVYRLVG